ncbi:response regulator [Chryseolinea soli]|uniref:Response regulator n=1 Tax=Chryseolinea soli TaxID=2321403 RepID=A0A385SHQ0_9BACT|nr:response regulator [Chryseolinea soli]AYB29986.1 response regulator [Chryseolinea soli]
MIKRILFIDDNVEDGRIFQQIIQELFTAITIDFARSGPQAFALLSKTRADVIFLELIMPGMDGIECLTKLKASRNAKQIPVVLYTASKNEMDKKLALKLGAFDVISKTSNLSALTDKIKKILSLPHYH